MLTPGLPQTGDQLVWTGLSGDSLPLAIASAARELNNVLVLSLIHI